MNACTRQLSWPRISSGRTKSVRLFMSTTTRNICTLITSSSVKKSSASTNSVREHHRDGGRVRGWRSDEGFGVR
jgi:hypothetical protein